MNMLSGGEVDFRRQIMLVYLANLPDVITAKDRQEILSLTEELAQCFEEKFTPQRARM